MTLRIAVPDLISNSYFPAVAAVQLGCFHDEGLEAGFDLLFPVDRAYRALRDGEIDIVAGSAHSALAAFPQWQGVKLLCAQGQGMYWFLVMRADLNPRRGDLSVVKGRRIGAAPWVEMGLRRLLVEGGIDLERDQVSIAPVPGAVGERANFGLMAAKALEEGLIDGFWANGMACELAVTSGTGAVVLDVRRGDGPEAGFNYTMASIAARDELAEDIGKSGAVVRAIVRAQELLRSDPSLAAKAVEGVFPEREAALIPELIRRDLPYYDASISPAFVSGMNRFARDLGILTGEPAYEDVVAVQCRPWWGAQVRS
jgi:NitT/TauT family transport system substrate-binding protein